MLCWAVVKLGQVVRFVQAPNHPTALTMLQADERLVGPGRSVGRVPLYFREHNKIEIYKHKKD